MNSRLMIRGNFFDAFLTPPPTHILSPLIKFEADNGNGNGRRSDGEVKTKTENVTTAIMATI